MHIVNAKGILSNNNMNVFRGCLHGCIYCDSRSDCYNINHKFEDIEVKINAPSLLEETLSKRRKKCMITTGSMTDPYIPLEKDLNITRECLEIILKYGFGLSILTKSDLILRDLDLLKQINEKAKCVVNITLTTFDETLCKILEPHVASTKNRFEVLKIMKENKIPTVVWLDPILPFINDNFENLSGILNYCKDASVKGIICFGMGLTLRSGNREYYYQKLDEYFPGLKEKYIKIYGNSYDVVSLNNKNLMEYFISFCKVNNILYNPNEVFKYIHTFEPKIRQLTLF